MYTLQARVSCSETCNCSLEINCFNFHGHVRNQCLDAHCYGCRAPNFLRGRDTPHCNAVEMLLNHPSWLKTLTSSEVERLLYKAKPLMHKAQPHLQSVDAVLGKVFVYYSNTLGTFADGSDWCFEHAVHWPISEGQWLLELRSEQFSLEQRIVDGTSMYSSYTIRRRWVVPVADQGFLVLVQYTSFEEEMCTRQRLAANTVARLTVPAPQAQLNQLNGIEVGHSCLVDGPRLLFILFFILISFCLRTRVLCCWLNQAVYRAQLAVMNAALQETRLVSRVAGL